MGNRPIYTPGRIRIENLETGEVDNVFRTEIHEGICVGGLKFSVGHDKVIWSTNGLHVYDVESTNTEDLDLDYYDPYYDPVVVGDLIYSYDINGEPGTGPILMEYNLSTGIEVELTNMVPAVLPSEEVKSVHFWTDHVAIVTTWSEKRHDNLTIIQISTGEIVRSRSNISGLSQGLFSRMPMYDISNDLVLTSNPWEVLNFTTNETIEIPREEDISKARLVGNRVFFTRDSPFWKNGPLFVFDIESGAVEELDIRPEYRWRVSESLVVWPVYYPIHSQYFCCGFGLIGLVVLVWFHKKQMRRKAARIGGELE